MQALTNPVAQEALTVFLQLPVVLGNPRPEVDKRVFHQGARFAELRWAQSKSGS